MIKKEKYNYFDEFLKDAEYILKSANLLKETLNNYSKELLEQNIIKMHKYENEADSILHKMRNHLIKDFLPPIDRDDIVLIGYKLDDVEDYIDEILKNFSILNITNIRNEVYAFIDLIIECANTIQETIKVLKTLKNMNLIKEKVIKINELEEKGDKLYENSIRNLYTESKDAIEIIKWSKVFLCLENTLDSCEQIANTIEDIITKNS